MRVMMRYPRTVMMVLLWSGPWPALGSEDAALDDMNCKSINTHQFSQIGERARRLQYNFQEPLALLFSILLQLKTFQFEKYEGKGDYIQTKNYLTGHLFGSPISWGGENSIKKSEIEDIPNSHRAVIDLYRLVTDPSTFTGLCLKGRVLTTYQLCRASLRASATLIPLEPPADPKGADTRQVQVLLMTSNSLEFENPDSARTQDSRTYIFRADQPATLVFNLTQMVQTQIFQILTQLHPFTQHLPGQERCSYYIFQSLCEAMFNKPCELIEGDDLIKVRAECFEYSVLWKNQRAERSVFDWLFTDQSSTILQLIKSQHKSVRADQLLATNDVILQRRVNSLARNLELLRNVSQDNFDKVQGILSNVEARRELLHVESVLRDNKLAIISSIGDLHSFIINVRSQTNQMVKSLFSELTDATNCIADKLTSRIACSERPGYVENINNGVITVNSPGRAYEMKNLLIFSCLFLHSNLYSHPTIFKGNRRGFLASEEFNYSKNLTCPRPCFENLKSDTYNCQKCLTNDLSTVLLPLFFKSFYFIMNGNSVFLQSINGVVRLVNNQNKEVNIGLRPHYISQSDFPLQTSDGVIHFSDLILNENASALSGFFLHEYSSKYFSEFDFSSARLGAQGFVKTQWEDAQQEIADLFEQSLVFRVLSITGLTCVGIGTLIMIFCIYFCFRRRQGQSKLINRVYSTVRSHEDGEDTAGRPPVLKRKPRSDQIGKTNRNHSLTGVVNALKRNNKKLAQELSAEEISLAPV